MLSVNANGDTDNNNNKKENQENKNRYGRKRRHNTYSHNFSKHYVGLVTIVVATFLLQNATTRTTTTTTMTASTTTMVFSFSIVTIRTMTRRRHHHHAAIIKTIPSLLQRYSKLDDFLSDTDGDVSRLVEQLELEQEQKQKLVVVSNNGTQTTDDNIITMTNNNNNNNNNNNSWIDGRKFSEEKYGNDDDSQNQQQQTSSPSPSPVETLTIRDRTIHIKSDQQLRLFGSGISGNKARKMWMLNEVPVSEFPKCLVSYGGPQSNSMLALAAITNYKNRELAEEEKEVRTTMMMNTNGSRNNNDNDNDNNISISTPIRFVYYTKKLPRFLKNQPNGNLFRALSLGMELKELSREEYSNLFEYRSEDNYDGGGGREGKRPPLGLLAPAPNSLYVPQGGAFSSALVGVNRLSEEIYTYWLEHGNDRPLTIFVPGGTCTTALCLHHGLKRLSLLADREDDDNGDYSSSAKSMMDIEVVVVPCIGDAAYARKQMMSLSTQIGAKADDIPAILQPEPEEQENLTSSSRRKYFTFGKPNKEILETFQELQKENNLLVDLLYGAPSFSLMFRHWDEDMKKNKDKPSLSPDLSFDPNQPLSSGREIMYVHSGGLEGITSQLLRYQHIGLMKIKDVQLPGRRNKKKGTEQTNT